MKTMLQIIQAAATELGIPKPNLVMGVNNTDTMQLLGLLNGLGGDLQREYIWQALCTEYRFNTQFLEATGTTTANSAVVTGLSATTGLDNTYQVLGVGVNQDTYVQTLDSATQVTMSQVASASGTVTLTFCKTKYSFPSDYDRPQDKTQWDKTQHWEMRGPTSPQLWQWLKSGYISTGPRIRFRPMGGLFQIWPAIAEAHYLGFEYISNAWVRGADGTLKDSFTADTDTCIFDDRMMITGLKAAYQKAKGLGDEFTEQYKNLLDIAKANDSGSETLSMCPRLETVLIGWDNIPDSGYGQ